jgi:hypothetical protein
MPRTPDPKPVKAASTAGSRIIPVIGISAWKLPKRAQELLDALTERKPTDARR